MDIKNTLRDKANSIFEIPESILTDEPITEMLGCKKVRVENHKGIVKYSESEIMIKTVDGVLKISGKNMHIESLIAGQTVISGEIAGMFFIK